VLFDEYRIPPHAIATVNPLEDFDTTAFARIEVTLDGLLRFSIRNPVARITVFREDLLVKDLYRDANHTSSLGHSPSLGVLHRLERSSHEYLGAHSLPFLSFKTVYLTDDSGILTHRQSIGLMPKYPDFTLGDSLRSYADAESKPQHCKGKYQDFLSPGTLTVG
jgi:hypothetical protein